MRGQKNTISKASFNRSTLKGVIRKGFISPNDIEKTNLPQYTRDEIKQYLKKESLLFVRDKQCLFIISGSEVYFSGDSNLLQYIEYFKSKNPQYSYIEKQWTPSDLRARGLAVEKIAEQNGFSL